MKVLVTGGAGYIGSTIVACSRDAGVETVVLDDLSTGMREFAEESELYVGDIADVELINRIIDEHPDIDAVVHCAASIVVPESVKEPLRYYENNVSKTLVLVRTLMARGIRRFLFSSTASMYAATGGELVDEGSAIDPLSPYSSSKSMVERLLRDIGRTGDLDTIALRYFNPIGADPQMRSGLQTPNPTHALGKMIEAFEQKAPFTVTGTEWPTRDGSGLRDYVHVWDLARAHLLALEKFDEVVKESSDPGFQIVNLGSGTGTTVFELLAAFESVVGATLDVRHAGPRLGDIAGCAPRTEKAERLLGWRAERNLEEGVADSLTWAAKLRTLLASREGGSAAEN